MAVHKFYDPRIYLAQFALAPMHAMIRVRTSADALDQTAFGDVTRRHLGGLLSHALEGEGYQSYGANEIEDVLRQQVGAPGGTVYTITPEGGALGEEAYFGVTLVTAHKPLGGQVGEIHKFTFSGVGANGYRCVKGQLFKPEGNTTSSGTSTGVQLGPVAAGQRVYASLHVFSVSGTNPTLDVVVESDDNGSFTSDTDRVTLAQATGITPAAGGVQFASAAGAITDEHWRIGHTIGGTDTPTFSFVVAVGIAAAH